MDEFIIVLAIALVLMGVIFLGFGSYYGAPPGKPATNLTVAADVTVGPVGFVSTVPAKIVQIKPFSAGTTQFETLKNWGSQEISAGFASREISETANPNKNLLDYTEKAVLEFDVNKDKTNSAEDLVIVWNRAEIFRGKPTEGHQAIRIPKQNITDSNTIRIYTSAPGLSTIVKSTAYNLDNLKLTQEYGQAKVEVFNLEPKEFEAFDKAEINFATVPRSGTEGKLILKVNGIEIYNQKPDRFILLTIDQNKIPTIGLSNRISFLAQGGLFEVTDPKINLYLLNSQVVKKRSFLLAEDQMKNLNNKNIRLELDSASSKPGTLTITLNSNKIDFSNIQEGANSKTISNSTLLVGENTMEFSATGTFEIRKARIVAE